MKYSILPVNSWTNYHVVLLQWLFFGLSQKDWFSIFFIFSYELFVSARDLMVKNICFILRWNCIAMQYTQIIFLGSIPHLIIIFGAWQISGTYYLNLMDLYLQKSCLESTYCHVAPLQWFTMKIYPFDWGLDICHVLFRAKALNV